MKVLPGNVDFDLAKSNNTGSAETPFDSSATDAFGVGVGFEACFSAHATPEVGDGCTAHAYSARPGMLDKGPLAKERPDLWPGTLDRGQF